MDVAYDEAVVSQDQPLSQHKQGVVLDDFVGALLARDGLAGHSAARTAALDVPPRQVVVVGDRYVAGPRDVMPGTAGATSCAQATSQLGSGERVLTVAEAS